MVNFFGAGDSVKGNGKVVLEKRSISSFSRIGSSGIVKVKITIGETDGIEIEGEENILPFIETEVSGGMLSVGTKPNMSISPTRNIDIRVSAPSLASIQISGLAENVVHGELNAENLDLEISDSASLVSQSLHAEKIKMNASGTSSILLLGWAKRLVLDASGTSNIAAQGLKCGDAKVELSGTSRANLTVTEKIKAELSGVSKLRVSGNPSIRSIDRSGLAKAEFMKETND